MAEKTEQMVAFWSERARLYGSDPRANTNDVWLREIEIDYVNRALQASAARQVLDFGCANGFSTRRLAQANPSCSFVGLDINEEMIRIADEGERLPNLQFRRFDLLREPLEAAFDFIYTVRVFQNLDSLETQKRVADRLFDRLNSKGSLLYVESYADGYTRLNEDRTKMGLNPLPIHPHLSLLTDEFDDYMAEKMQFVRRDALSSTYYLVTRLVYSYIAKTNGEAIDYNHPLHQVAAMVPQIGDYGPQRASLFIKP